TLDAIDQFQCAIDFADELVGTEWVDELVLSSGWAACASRGWSNSDLRLRGRIGHFARRALDRAVNLRVLTAAADVARHALGDRDARCALVRLQQRVAAHDEAARAHAALDPTPHPERSLDGVQAIDARSALKYRDRHDLLTAAQASGEDGAAVDG